MHVYMCGSYYYAEWNGMPGTYYTERLKNKVRQLSTLDTVFQPQHDRVNQTVPDAMHTIKDCVEKLVCIIIGNSKCIECMQ